MQRERERKTDRGAMNRQINLSPCNRVGDTSIDSKLRNNDVSCVTPNADSVVIHSVTDPKESQFLFNRNNQFFMVFIRTSGVIIKVTAVLTYFKEIIIQCNVLIPVSIHFLPICSRVIAIITDEKTCSLQIVPEPCERRQSIHTYNIQSQ